MKLFLLLLTFTLSAFTVSAQKAGKTNEPSDVPLELNDLDVKPHFLGKNSFEAEVQKLLRLPEVDENIDVIVEVGFIIEDDGSVSNVKCLKDPGYGLGETAVRAVTAVKTGFKPGKKKRKPVRVAIVLPIRIKIIAN